MPQDRGLPSEAGIRATVRRMSDPALELAKNRAWPLLERLNLRLESGDMTEQAWYDEVASVIVPAYLAGTNPRSQSGSDGSVQD